MALAYPEPSCPSVRCAAVRHQTIKISNLITAFAVVHHYCPWDHYLRLPCCFNLCDFSNHFLFALLRLPLLLTFVPLFPHRLTVGRNGRREDANCSEGG